MSDVKWIKVATDIFDNRKIKQIETMPDGDGMIVVWLKLLCLAGSINDKGQIYLTQEIPYTEQMLATQFNRPIQLIQMSLHIFEEFGMVKIIDDILKISSWERYQNVEGLEKIREQNRKRVAKHREKKKLEMQKKDDVMTCNVTEMLQVTHCNDAEKNREEQIREEKTREDKTNELFESLWSLYPRKRGKSQVSKKSKKDMLRIGYDEMARCIERYREDTKGTEEQYIMYGSTFFNSGYVDYLDENYVPKSDRFSVIGNWVQRKEGQ